jgi:hypothetical protein
MRAAFWRRACQRLVVILATCALGLVGMSLVLPAAVASAKQPATGSPTPMPSASAGKLRLALPQLMKPLITADIPAPSTISASYSCDFSNYGAGITAATMSATFSYESSWPVNQPMDVAFTNSEVTLPSQVSSQLTGVGSMTLAASVTAQNATQSTVALSGPTLTTLPNPPTTIPQTLVVGQVTFPATGTGALELPPQTIVVTPMAGATAQPVITCTTQTAATAQSVTVGAASGPFYNCVTTVQGGGVGAAGTESGPIDMTVTASGTKQVGKTVTVKLSSDGVAALIDGLAVGVTQLTGVQISKVTFASALAVQGPQPGTLHPSATVTDFTATSFSASEALKLTKSGTTTVDIPSKWQVDFFVATTDAFDIACTLVTTPAPAGLTLKVSKASSAGSGSGNDDAGSTGQGGTTEASGAPAGGVATGGGLAPGADMPLAAGGLAIVLAGAVLVARSARRRRARG